MSLHNFDPSIAQRVGVNAAVIYQNFLFWCEKNKANKRHIRDGYVWTYNSRRALSELFPYLTESQIKTALSKLVEHGLIVKGEYNLASYDRTCWYSPTVTSEWVSAIGQKSPMERTEMANGLAKNHQPIPDSKPDTKPDSKPDISDPDAFDAFNEIAEGAGWPKVQLRSKARKATLSARIQDCGGYENWLDAMRRAAKSEFLLGKATGTTPASFDWLHSPRNFTKVMEGNYDNRATDKTRNSGTDTTARQIAFAARAARSPSEDCF